MKPIALIENMLLNNSKEQNLIIDFFIGSGSTMVASHQLSRNCYGMEIDPHYVFISLQRIKKLEPSINISCLNRTFDIEKELTETT